MLQTHITLKKLIRKKTKDSWNYCEFHHNNFICAWDVTVPAAREICTEAHIREKTRSQLVTMNERVFQPPKTKKSPLLGELSRVHWGGLRSLDEPCGNCCYSNRNQFIQFEWTFCILQALSNAPPEPWRERVCDDVRHGVSKFIIAAVKDGMYKDLVLTCECSITQPEYFALVPNAL